LKQVSALSQFRKLEKLGRERLSPNFFMREFLHSEISQVERVQNIPHYPEIAIRNGSLLCQCVLEPLQAKLGRLSVRSGYRSPEINAIGAKNKNQYNCASNQRNTGGHIWDYPDSDGQFGATACIIVCSYVDYYEKTGDWRSLANWIHSNIPHFSSLCFFPKLCAINISWSENPSRRIRSYIAPRGTYQPVRTWSPNAKLPS